MRSWFPCLIALCSLFFFFSSRRRHTRCGRDWSSDVCSSDLFNVTIKKNVFDPREERPGSSACFDVETNFLDQRKDRSPFDATVLEMLKTIIDRKSVV